MFNDDGLMKMVSIILAVVIVGVLALGIIISLFNGVPKLSPAKAESIVIDETNDEAYFNDDESVDASFSDFAVKGGKTASKAKIKKEDEKSDEESEDEEIDETDYICEFATSRLINNKDMKKIMSKDYPGLPGDRSIQQMVINEMYARHGYKFTTESIQEYFDGKEWYRDIEDYESDMNIIYDEMSSIEKENIDFLQNYEQ